MHARPRRRKNCLRPRGTSKSGAVDLRLYSLLIGITETGA